MRLATMGWLLVVLLQHCPVWYHKVAVALVLAVLGMVVWMCVMGRHSETQDSTIWSSSRDVVIFGFMSSSSTASKQRDESGRWCSWIYVGGTVAVGVGFPHSLFEYLNPKGRSDIPSQPIGGINNNLVSSRIPWSNTIPCVIVNTIK